MIDTGKTAEGQVKMWESVQILRVSAFTRDGVGGNPAGVVLQADGLSDAEMLAIARDVGYSETAFLFPILGELRFFSPLAEVPFCGHATIATAVAAASRGLALQEVLTRAGRVSLETSGSGEGTIATLTSPPASSRPLVGRALDQLLATLGIDATGIDPRFPPHVAFAGEHHPMLAVRNARTLAGLDYEFETLAELMTAEGWITVNVFHALSGSTFEARNPFPPGGVVEDAATGAAAAAFGGYLRDIGADPVDGRVTVLQGQHMGRPSLLHVDVRSAQPRVRVSGAATIHS